MSITQTTLRAMGHQLTEQRGWSHVKVQSCIYRALYSTVHTYSGLKYRYKPTVLLEAESSSRSENYLPVRTIYILWCHSSGKKRLATFLGAEKQVNILLLYSVYRGNHQLAVVIWINGMETN